MSLDELVGRAQQLVDEGVTPACQLAVARDGQMLAFETFGDATNENRFCAFSATKPIVASVVWMMMSRACSPWCGTVSGISNEHEEA